MSEYLVKSREKSFNSVVVQRYALEKSAIEAATALAIETGEPHEVYEIKCIGCSTIPKSSFIDYRPQVAQPEIPTTPV